MKLSIKKYNIDKNKASPNIDIFYWIAWFKIGLLFKMNNIW